MVRVLFATATCIFLSGCFAVPNGPDVSITQEPVLSADASMTDADAGIGAGPNSDRPNASKTTVSRSSVEKSCKRGSTAFIGDRYADCVKQEMEAKQQLAQLKKYSVADRQACASEDSYVEQLTCLQVKDWLKHPDETTETAAKVDQPPKIAKSPSVLGAPQP
jgi:hypothetical protein